MTSRLVLLLATPIFLASASAAAAAADAGKVYSGGHLTGRSGATAIKGTALVRAVVAGDGVSASVTIEANTSCGLGFIRMKVPVAADGSFSGSDTGSETTPEPARQTSTVTIQGRFDGRAASGTFAMKLKVDPRRGRTRRCSGDFPFGLREAPTGDEDAVPAAPRPGADYFGVTDALTPFVLHANEAGTSIAMAAFRYTLKCSGGRVSRNEYTPKVAIRADHSFTMTERFKQVFSDGVERTTVTMRGGFVEGAVGGEARVTTVFRDRRGRVLDRCRTPLMAFYAAV